MSVTEPEENRRKARDSQAICREVLNSIPQSIFWKDENGVYLGCNVVFARAAGLGLPGEIVGKTGPGFLLLVGITHGDTPELVAQMAQKTANLRIFDDVCGNLNRSAPKYGMENCMPAGLQIIKQGFGATS